MSSRMPLTRIKIIALSLLTLFIISSCSLYYADQKIQQSIEEKSFLAPTRYYSSPSRWRVGETISLERLQKHFIDLNYRQKDFGSALQAGDWSFGETEQCHSLFGDDVSVQNCAFYRNTQNQTLYMIAWDEMNQVIATLAGEDLQPTSAALGEADIFAQYLGDQPTQQTPTSLGDIPRYCLDAVIAIEDPLFLEHQGISFKGLTRALFANVKQVRWSQGGSTITQQLVKNYFLTPEKTLTRKIKEIVMSLLFELRVSKDDILETYLNIIYLGQSGVFEVRGYGSASDFYFQKPIARLTLADCALLAAIVNSPGRYHPVNHPQRAHERRTKVLDKMLEQGRISTEEHQEALQAPLPQRVKSSLAASAPYYVDAVNKQLKAWGITDRSGLHVYTALSPAAQDAAEQAVKDGLKHLEKNNPRLLAERQKNQRPLEASLLASDPRTGEVVALVGGRAFSSSPYNRAFESRRQVGSIFKPLVFLSALEQPTVQGLPFGPLTPLDNSPLKIEYDRQQWEPQNYDKKFSGPRPAFYILKESINVATARLAMAVGLEEVIETAHRLHIKSPLKKYPSLALGAFELAPLEVLSAFNTFSQWGHYREPLLVHQVLDQKGEVRYQTEQSIEQVGRPEDYAILVGMMKETLRTGTGRWVRDWGFNGFAAGKTGTTSDFKDAWFAGFTPYHTAVVWVGYDDGTPHQLTGSSGALPIWSLYMKKATLRDPAQDFSWPQGVEKVELSADELLNMGIEAGKAADTELIQRVD